MLDAATNTPVSLPQQDVAHPNPAPTPSGCRLTWHVAATKPRAERIAHAALHHRGYAPYLPLTLGRPLFPGYCFLQLSTGQPWYPIAWAPGVFQLLQCNGKPIPCPTEAVEAIQAGDELRSIPMSREYLYRPGAPCVASLGGGQSADAVVVTVRHRKATILTIMFGQLREIAVSLNNLSFPGDT